MMPLLLAKMLSLPMFAVASNVACSKGGFLGFPPWWEYLSVDPSTCTVSVHWPSGIWLIGLAILDILLRIAGIAAVISIIVASVMYVTSAGSPDRAGSALQRIVSSLVGLAIVLAAAVTVSFIGHHLA